MNQRPQTRLTVKFSDCDPFGHLYNVRYLDYLFDGREQHVIEHYPLLRTEMMSRQRNWVIAATDIRYLHPAALGECVIIESSVFNITRHGVMLEIAMLDAAAIRPKAVLWSRLQYVDLERGAIVYHPPQVQAFLDEVGVALDAASLDARVKALLQGVPTAA
ncbi:acyl-CoA thioesterase [Chitiniphilus purpureus]|uniref:Acyl-CoA thioesterase n=1 Tax=Chitiniphilus purpureus TaxID=2981137 RepID=A0ABY6DGY0_9NEIS|nr:acyl-CoA thioesterase [Chitiniphilus sp. CD1]UXY13615.1 acyl-CoA thioesterase [Chitiniphilus sp. CD1]